MDNLTTEQRNPKTMNLDKMSIRQILRVMNEEDTVIPLAIRDMLTEIEQVVKRAVDSMNEGGRIIYCGAGTSGRMAVMDAVETVPTFNASVGLFSFIMAGGMAALTQSVEAVEDNWAEGKADLLTLKPNANDMVIGVTASGRTPYVGGVLEHARSLGCSTALICNVERPELVRLADVTIRLLTGPEVLTGSTRLKAGSAQKMVLNMISTVSMIHMGKVYSNLMVDVQTLNEKLKVRAINIVCEATEADESTAKSELEAVNWHCKTAIAKILLGVDTQEAKRRLETHKGFIRKALNKK